MNREQRTPYHAICQRVERESDAVLKEMTERLRETVEWQRERESDE